VNGEVDPTPRWPLTEEAEARGGGSPAPHRPRIRGERQQGEGGPPGGRAAAREGGALQGGDGVVKRGDTAAGGVEVRVRRRGGVGSERRRAVVGRSHRQLYVLRRRCLGGGRDARCKRARDPCLKPSWLLQSSFPFNPRYLPMHM